MKVFEGERIEKTTLTKIWTNHVKGFPFDNVFDEKLGHNSYMMLSFLLTESKYYEESAFVINIQDFAQLGNLIRTKVAVSATPIVPIPAKYHPEFL